MLLYRDFTRADLPSGESDHGGAVPDLQLGKSRCHLRGGTTCFRYVTRKRIITNIPIAHVIHRLYAGFLTDRHWTVVRNLKLRRGLLIVQLKESSILVQFIENDRNKV